MSTPHEYVFPNIQHDIASLLSSTGQINTVQTRVAGPSHNNQPTPPIVDSEIQPAHIHPQRTRKRRIICSASTIASSPVPDHINDEFNGHYDPVS